MIMTEYVSLEHYDTISEKYFIVQWCLGNVCNYSCSYCPINLHNGSVPWTSISTIENLINKIKLLHPDKKLYFEFTGGEITVNKDFIDICKLCKSNNIFIKFLTNGSRTIRWWEENKQHFDHVIMSFHSEFADPNHFCDVIKTLKDDCLVHANIVMSLDNWDKCIDVANEVKEIGNCSVYIKPLKEDISGKMYSYSDEQLSIFKNQKQLFGSQVKWTKSIPKEVRGLMKSVDKDNNIVNVSSYSDFFVKGTNSWLGWQCWAGIEQIIIDLDGSIYRGWCKVGGCIGNVNDDFILPDDPIICTKTFCGCASDVMCTKRKIV